MRYLANINRDEISPSAKAILIDQGIGGEALTHKRFLNLARRAQDIFARLAEPLGVLQELTVAEFDRIYWATEYNQSPGPIEQIYHQADRLALFAATVGERVNAYIKTLFNDGEFALASMLDSTASLGADAASKYLAEYFLDQLHSHGHELNGQIVLGYSPGYCGWHVSAQKALFDALQPEEIGVTLRESFLMEPLKSVSGVLVCGEQAIHEFDNSFPFCADCPSQPCIHRMTPFRKT